MNASDIVKAKQCGALYKAYYQPTVFQSTVISTISLISTVSTGGGVFTSTASSCTNTIYTYTCNSPIISYELANDIECGKFVCGGKVPSVTTWRANRAMGINPAFGSTFGTSTLTNSTINTSTLSSSANFFAVRPLICPDPIFVQGTNFQSQCDVCNNFGAGVGACCHNCASGQ